MLFLKTIDKQIVIQKKILLTIKKLSKTQDVISYETKGRK
jgi:hypothetical protein